MSFANYYLRKHSFLPVVFEEPPAGLLKYIVVIPVYNEKNILHTLDSLITTNPIASDIEIVLIINSGEHDSLTVKKQNFDTIQTIEDWKLSNITDKIKVFAVLVSDMPKKHAGAGLARKIGMDIAVSRFNMINQPQGLILSMDADTLVEPGYFTEIDKVCIQNPAISGLIIHFEHPTEGNEYSEEVYAAITQYELYLRYFKLLVDFTGYPYGGYTIGSCFGVKAHIYSSNGGMNRKQAGEDFYFLQKIFPLGEFADIKTTKVIPSPRPSGRVPFGTGPVVQKLIENKNELEVYHYKGFEHLNTFFGKIEQFYHNQNDLSMLSKPLRLFLNEINFNKALQEIRDNTSGFVYFEKRFFRWFNTFQIIKYLNYLSENHLPKIGITEAINHLCILKGIDFSKDLKKNLDQIRNYELHT